jgi:SNF2 family DNA or RNA helicase
MRFGVVIVDESHYMKNRKAARTKALISVIKQAKRAVLLTGTPALARPEEVQIQSFEMNYETLSEY